MNRLDSRLAKLENITNKKPIIWASVPKPAGNSIAERDKDKEMLREFASRYFGVTDFHFSIFSPPKATSLSFSYIEAADFAAIWDSVSSKGLRIHEADAPSEDTRDRNEILADYLEQLLFETETEEKEPEAA